MTNEEAIKWLKLQKSKGILWDDYSDETRGIRENAELRIRIAYEMAIEALEQQPKTGHWIEKEDYNLDTYYECSECGADYCIEGDILIHKYCPNCGAKMDEVETEVEDDQQRMD